MLNIIYSSCKRVAEQDISADEMKFDENIDKKWDKAVSESIVSNGSWFHSVEKTSVGGANNGGVRQKNAAGAVRTGASMAPSTNASFLKKSLAFDDSYRNLPQDASSLVGANPRPADAHGQQTTTNMVKSHNNLPLQPPSTVLKN